MGKPEGDVGECLRCEEERPLVIPIGDDGMFGYCQTCTVAELSDRIERESITPTDGPDGYAVFNAETGVVVNVHHPKRRNEAHAYAERHPGTAMEPLYRRSGEGKLRERERVTLWRNRCGSGRWSQSPDGPQPSSSAYEVAEFVRLPAPTNAHEGWR